MRDAYFDFGGHALRAAFFAPRQSVSWSPRRRSRSACFVTPRGSRVAAKPRIVLLVRF